MKNNKKNYIKLFLLLFIVFIFSGLIISKIYLLNHKYINVFDEINTNLVIGSEIIRMNNPVKVENDAIFVSFDVMKKYIDPNIFWDEKLQKVTVTTHNKLIRMKTGSLTALVNNKPTELKFPVTNENNTIFVPIEFLEKLYNIDVSFIKSNNVVVIDLNSQKKQSAAPLNDEIVLKQWTSFWAPAVKRINSKTDKENSNMLVFESNEKWCKVRALDGTIGYVKKEDLKIQDIPMSVSTLENTAENQWKPQKGKINLVWEAIYNVSPDTRSIGKIEGLDVVSPTWFQVTDAKGTVANKVNTSYLKWAKEMGYKVWALVSNNFNNPKITGEFLNDSDARDNMMRQLLSFAALYKLDGINIDFENINIKDKNALTQFVRELTPLLNEQGMIVSIDVGVPDGSDNWSRCYDRKALSEIVDYVIVMAYDQYWATSSVAGSVAQIWWVESNIKKMLLEVPKNKLILGMPFYSRLWEEKTDENGNTKLTSQSHKMTDVKELLKRNQVTPVWNEASGQFYSEYKKNGATYKVWIEDSNSINLKSSLAQKYDLAGCASWNRSFAEKSVWTVLSKNLKEINNYQEWLAKNNSNRLVYNLN